MGAKPDPYFDRTTEVHTFLSEAKPKRRFFHPFHPETYDISLSKPPLKDGEVEVFEDLFSLPETKVEVFENGEKVNEYVMPARFAENQKNLSLRSLLTGEVTTFCKWPGEYFGDKGRGPFSSHKKALEGSKVRRSMRFDSDGKRM